MSFHGSPLHLQPHMQYTCDATFLLAISPSSPTIFLSSCSLLCTSPPSPSPANPSCYRRASSNQCRSFCIANTYTAVNTPPSSSAKGKLDLEPFCVFEKGSTSTASGDQQNVTPKIVSNKEEKNYQMKLRRRDTYMKITAERKQAMILQRRTKELELQKNKSVTGCPGEKIKSPRNPTSLKQVALTIREPPFGNVQDSMYCEINTLSSSSAKGKQVLQPFPMFESGSTSNTYKRQQNVTPEIPAKKGKPDKG
ncbi:uncharacterized protein LOC124895669 [Capsicum annuum]|uniref:uncharacterized protein LOC124895639 n=1 Tax=Capsicum annuum TaxID=4072 RepID=UPI001FB0D89F|nr:uncharacterized protein LOC124895639 [Capsicum annuum]XP_047262049.1 uncharacterized protein LOC107858689 [Capsicum annuum]XP_047262062.1 uncharacterized protein LOC124895669 [Capsicum annuum]